MLSRAPETRAPVSGGGDGCDPGRLCRVDACPVISCLFIHQRKQLKSPAKETSSRRHGEARRTPCLRPTCGWGVCTERAFLTWRWDASCLSQSLLGTRALRSHGTISNCTNQMLSEFPEWKDTEPLLFLITWHLGRGRHFSEKPLVPEEQGHIMPQIPAIGGALERSGCFGNLG